MRSRRLVLPVMAGTFGIYVVMHSPLRDVVAALLRLNSRVCYFVCGDGQTVSGALNSATAWLLIIAAAAAGWIVSDQFDAGPHERPLVFGMTALAFVSAPAAAVAGIGTWSGTALLRPPFGPLLAAIPAALVVGVGLRRGWRPYLPRLILERPPGLVLLVGGLAASLLLTSAGLSLMYPPSGYDALSYHAPLAVFFWRDGDLTAFLDRGPVVYTLAMPGTVQLWYGLLLMAGGERLADLGQLPFALGGSVAICVFARRLGLGRGAAQLAGAAYLLAPPVVMLSGMQVADAAAAGLLMATMSLASAPVATWTWRRFALLGLGLGLVATTKLALLPCVVGVILFVVAATVWHMGRQRRAGAVAVRLGLVALVFCTIVAPWWLRNATRYGNPVYPAGIPLIGRGIFLSTHVARIDREFVPRPVLWPLYPLFERHSERSGLGALFLVGAIVGSVMAACRARRQPLLIFSVVVGCTLPTWWILTNHDPRFLLGIFGLAFAFLPYSLLAVLRPQRRAAGALVAMTAIFSALVTLDQAVLPLAQRPTPRLEFYDAVWGVDPRVASLPESEGLVLQTGYAPYSYPAYYPLLGRSRTRLVLPVDREATTDSLVARMHQMGVRYAYVITSPESEATVEAIYDPSHFQLASVSVVAEGWRSGTRRYLYRLK